MGRLLAAMGRGFRSRCPACGRGRLRTRWLRFADRCSDCDHVFLADPGDWTGAAETTFILTVAAGVLAWIGAGWAGLAGTERIVASLVGGVVAFAWIFPRVRGAWIGVLSVWADPSAPPRPGLSPSAEDPDWEHPSLFEK